MHNDTNQGCHKWMAQIQTVKKDELKKWPSWSKVKEEAEEDLLLQMSVYSIGTVNALKKDSEGQ